MLCTPSFASTCELIGYCWINSVDATQCLLHSNSNISNRKRGAHCRFTQNFNYASRISMKNTILIRKSVIQSTSYHLNKQIQWFIRRLIYVKFQLVSVLFYFFIRIFVLWTMSQRRCVYSLMILTWNDKNDHIKRRIHLNLRIHNSLDVRKKTTSISEQQKQIECCLI